MLNNLPHKLSVNLTEKTIQINNLANLELKIEFFDLLKMRCVVWEICARLGIIRETVVNLESKVVEEPRLQRSFYD